MEHAKIRKPRTEYLIHQQPSPSKQIGLRLEIGFIEEIRTTQLKVIKEVPKPYFLFCRGGVEDATFEAKDTKKSEDKAKDRLHEDRPSQGQEHKAQAFSPPKKSSPKFFSGDLQKKNFFPNFPRGFCRFPK